jgi:hypothetical protein
MKILQFLTSFFLLFIFSTTSAQTYTTGIVNLSATAGLAMTAKIDVGTQVTLTLTGPAGRWFALGFNASSMTNGTDVVGVHSATTLSAFDCKLTGFASPVTDPQQNWTITSDVVNAGTRTIIASRALNTGDANDYVFPSTPTAISLIWARSGSATFSYSNHGGSNRGVVAASFTLVPPPTPPAAPTGAASQSLCAGATINQLSATGTAIQWYTTPTGGSPLALSTVLIGGSTYYATQTVNGLESTNRLAVTVTINTIPIAPTTIVGDLNFCYSGGVQLFNTPSIPGASSYVWSTPTGATGSSTGTNISLIFSPSFLSGSLSVLAQNSCGQSTPFSVVINQYLQSNTTININTCNSYDWNGQTYTQSGTYNFSGQTIHGCDSSVILNLNISPSITETINAEACGSYPWNGQTFWASGTYIDSLQTASGCDSIVTLDLIVHPITSIVLDSTVLDSFTWNGNTYTTSGQYTQFFTSVHGCDSTVTINLTIEDSGLNEDYSNFKISPNPVGKGGSLFVTGLQKWTVFEIVNSEGKIIQKGQTEGQIHLNSEVAKGTYFLKIEEVSIPVVVLE